MRKIFITVVCMFCFVTIPASATVSDLWMGIFANDLDQVKLAIADGTDVNTADSNVARYMPLYFAVYGNKKIEIIEYLIDKGANVNYTSNDPLSSGSVLYAAIENGNIDIVRLLVDKGANVNYKSSSGSVLEAAIKKGNIDIVRLLVDKGADVDPDGVLYAAIVSKTDILQYIVDQRNGNINISNSDDIILRVAAGESDSVKKVEYLIGKGADMNDVDSQGWNVLLWAVYWDDLPLVKYLVEEKHMDINSATSDGLTAMAVALTEDNGNSKIVAWLRSQGASVGIGSPNLLLKSEILRIAAELKNIESGFKVSRWKTATGNFNTARLASDSIAGVVLGTAGGLITSSIIKKNQTKHGFEDLKCVINGQNVAGYGDEFSVGIR